MPWAYEHNPANEIVEVTFSGSTSGSDLRELTSELIQLEKDSGVNRILIDTAEMEISASLVDIFNLPAKQYIEEGADRRARVAVLLPTSDREKEAVQFYKMVCSNRGWRVQVFPERQDAIRWLTDGNASGQPDES